MSAACFAAFDLALRQPDVQAVAMLAGALILVATVFYRLVEGWSLLDSAYFSVVTIATIGYGDLVPHTALGKIFTIAYVFSGIGISSRPGRRSPRPRCAEPPVTAQPAERQRDGDQDDTDGDHREPRAPGPPHSRPKANPVTNSSTSATRLETLSARRHCR